jgi:uncharacterized iron-regulated membrane protein
MATLPPSRLYRTIWRWHFYAGLIVAPFLLILAVTGSIYLFNDEINDRVYPEQRFVAPHASSVPLSTMLRAALAAYPGGASRIDMPTAPNRSAVVFVTPTTGAPLRVSVDPGSGRVLGSLVYDRTLVGFADTMHGSLTLGTGGDRIVELAACWALLLIASGVYLWLPRGREAAVFRPRLRGTGRVFWRDLHAVVGVWTVAFIAFMLVTGLPWAGVEGDLIQRVSTAAGVGYPPSHSTHNPPKSVPMKQALGASPWTLETMPMPISGEHAGHAGHAMGAGASDAATMTGADRAAAVFRAHHLSGYRLFLPAGPTGVYTAYTYPDQPEGQRTLYVDRWSGRLIREVDFAEYGIVGRAVELGVQLHMGNYFGLANQILMLIPCLAVVTLVISGFAMWWKRRPAGRLAAPPRVAGAPVAGLIAIIVVAGAVMPLLGASLVAVVLVDRIVVLFGRRRALTGNMVQLGR